LQDETSQAVVRTGATARSSQTVHWVIAVLLAVIATTLLLRQDDRGMSGGLAMAQNQPINPRLGARGIYAFTGQLTRNSYGLFLLDVDAGTVWCYEVGAGNDGAKQLRLVAARSWVYDRYLEEFNVTDPTPSAVESLVARQLAQQKQQQTENPASTTQPDSSVPPDGGK